jgi:hypothetical protein|tara:strand:+ start:1041 stop:1553 length:513 start_codon:yes stop_codon:yes gene_type:complete
MTINTQEKMHGAAILRLIEALSKELPNANFALKTGVSQSAYYIEGIVPKTLGKGRRAGAGLFIKVSNKRLSPWRYSFHQDHQDEILKLKSTHGETFIALIAGDDGIAGFDFNLFKEVLDDLHEEQEWVSVTRKPRENYRIKGNNGTLKKPLPRNSFPSILVDYFKRELGL